LSVNSRFKRFWSDPVWSKVISVGIVALLTWIGGALFKWWSWAGVFETVQGWGRGLWAFLMAPAAISHWLLGILILMAVIFILILFSVWVSAARTSSQEASTTAPQIQSHPPWLSYTSDVFYNLRWRWAYTPTFAVDQSSLAIFCTHCDYQLIGESHLPSDYTQQITFRCRSCGRAVHVQEAPAQLEGIVLRLIHQKIRNDAATKHTGSQ